MITSKELRKKYLEFFKAKGHTVIPSASLIPENDPTVLFTTAGMHPLVPYLLGEPHPGGKRLANAQKCIRTGDIDEVGDNRHLTFFEMLGNWSLGDYFKKDAIEWSFAFLTDKKWFGIDPKRLYVSVFAGDSDAPEDKESIGIWQEQYTKVGIDAKVGERIFTYPKTKNWWGPAGQTGPCGPDTEMFYDIVGMDKQKSKPLPRTAHHPDRAKLFTGDCHPNCDCGRYVEIWNDVFMEYNKNFDGKYEPLVQKNVDTGMGLERMTMVLQNAPTVFETDLFSPIIEKIEQISGTAYQLSADREEFSSGSIGGQGGLADYHIVRAMRIIADHIKAATFIIGDPRGVAPSNVDQGYIVRRLIRRAVRQGKIIGIDQLFTVEIAKTIIDLFSSAYPELKQNEVFIFETIEKEENKFKSTLERGLKELDKLMRIGKIERVEEGQEYPIFNRVDAKQAFDIYQTYGFPLEMIQEELARKLLVVDEKEFKKEFDEYFKKHQDLSRAGATQKFSGGLADHSWEVIRQHTATHLLDQALRDVLGKHVEQKGSNITKERLRFDFTHPQKMTDEEKKRVEEIVNEKVKEDLPVRYDMLTVSEAKSAGAIGLFEEKYATMGEKVKVYSIGPSTGSGQAYSKEICGGPHVEHTAQVGKFTIVKEEAVSAGIRRIKAIVG